MRDDDHRAVALDGVDTCLDLLGGDGVERGGRLVEEDDRRILQEHTRDGDTLLLTAREQLRLRIEAVGQLHNLVIDIRFAGCLLDLLACGVGASVADILLDRTVEDVVLLQHHTDIVAQELGVVLAQIDPV